MTTERAGSQSRPAEAKTSAPKKVVRRAQRPAVRTPKAAAVPVNSASFASLRPTPAAVPVAAAPRVVARPAIPPAAQSPKLLPAGHQGPDATMMYFLSLMLLLIIFFGTLVVVQQVLLIEAKSRLFAFARTAGGSAARLQVEVGQLREQLESTQAALAQARAQPQPTVVQDPDGAFRLTLPQNWFAVLDRAGTLDDLATPPADAVWRIALGPGLSPVIGGSLPIVIAKVAPAAAARYQRNFTNTAAETLILPNTDAAVKVTGVAGRRLVVVRVGETLYAIRYQLANDEDRALEQIALAITFTPR